MDSSTAQHHHQEMGSQTLESMLVCTKVSQQEKKPRPTEEALKCPRCDSTSTKFCYYNNYSLSQPRYFCKSCRRYWTKGGTLRNVPVGGGCRKNNKRSSSLTSPSSSSTSSPLTSSKRNHDQPPLLTSYSNPLGSLTPLSYDSSDLTLAFARLQKQGNGQFGFDDHEFPIFSNPNNAHFLPFDHGHRNGFLETPNNFHNFYYGHVENGGGGGLGISTATGDMAMPYEDLSGSTTSLTTVKQEICNVRDGDQNRVLWGFPFQINNGGDANMVDLDSAARQSWNGLGSSWHGLINSPLM